MYVRLYKDADQINCKLTCMSLVNMLETNNDLNGHDFFLNNLSEETKNLARAIVRTKKEISEFKSIIKRESLLKIKVKVIFSNFINYIDLNCIISKVYDKSSRFRKK